MRFRQFKIDERVRPQTGLDPERLKKIESGEVKPNKISTDLEGKKLREAYIRFRDASDQEIEIC